MKTKKIMRLFALFLVAVAGSSAFAFTGCGREDGPQGEKADADKTQLFIQNFDGGGGSQWLYDVKERFEEKYKDVSFENGKMGVQLMITPNKVVGTAFSPKTSSHEVVFIEAMSYFDYAAAGDMLDISDVAAEVFAQDGVSIEEEYYKALTALDKDGDGKGEVYALPHYEFYGGVAYNKNIWNDYGFYFAGDENGYPIVEGDSFEYTDATGTLSRGPDRIKGTSDDGLPETWEEYLDMCDYMLARSVTPLIITGQHHSYFYYFLYSAVSALGGYDELKAAISYDGAVDYVTSIEKNASAPLGYTYTTEHAEIQNSNGYLGSQTESKFVALAAAEKLQAKVGNKYKYFYQPALLNTTSHLDAQEYYINSQYNNTPIAMLIDGSWWENEATEAFESLAKVDPSYSKMNSNYGWMPLPTSVDVASRKDDSLVLTDYDLIRAYAFINANIAPQKVQLAKDFLKFCYTKEELQRYTQSTGLAKGLQYEITESNYNAMSPFSKDLWNYRASRKIVRPITDNPLVIYEAIGLDAMWTTKLNEIPHVGMFEAYGDAKKYFGNMKETQEEWIAKYSKYF